MLVFRGIPQSTSQSTVLTIGNFDGVHLGHQALLQRLVSYARQVALPAAVMTFEPHPREFFAPDSASARLTSLREKLELLQACNVERVHVCRFNAQLAALDAQQFIEKILVRGLSVRHLIIGDDFRFGRGRSGDFSMLAAAGIEHRYTLEAMSTVQLGDTRVSSSSVREALQAGDLARATQLLGRPYSISGRVVHGDKLGKQLGFPTANIQMKHNRPPLSGIFVVEVSGIGARNLQGVASLGVRPTVHAKGRPVLEVNLFDFEREIYGRHLRVDFLHKLRDEEKYADLEILKQKIARDVENARNYFLHN